MKRVTFKCTIKNEQCDVKTLVVAENEVDALAQVMAKFKDINYSEEDVTITLFADGYK